MVCLSPNYLIQVVVVLSCLLALCLLQIAALCFLR